MNVQSKYVLLCAIALIVLPVALSSMSGEISATDWTYRHSVWIRQYLSGDFSPMAIYPPLFEFLMAPFVAVNFPMAVFQVVFISISILGILYFTLHVEGENAVLLTAIMLAASVAFVEFASALMPQAIDYLIFPLAALAYFKQKPALAAGLTAAISLMHNTGIIFCGIFLLHAILTARRREIRYFLPLFIVLAGVFAFYQAAPIATWDVAAQVAWEMQYMWPPWIFFGMSGFLTWALLGYAVFKYKKSFIRLSDTQLFYVIWILAFFILLANNYSIGWRIISYQIVPLTLLVASKLKGEELRF